MPVRAKDLAEQLGVSRSTMSLVINGKPGVSDAKRAEILRKIHEMNCEHLLHTAPQEYTNVGFVIFRRGGSILDEHPFFAYFLQEMTGRLKEKNFSLTVLYMSASMTLAEQRDVIENSGCAGFIIFAVEMRYEDMQVFKESHRPFVMLDNSFLFNDVDTVAINNASGIRTAVNYLVARGHREIGYSQSRVQINSFRDRFDAYRQMLQAHGLRFREEYVAKVGYSDAEARQDMMRYVGQARNLPTAFVSDNDLVACGAVRGLQGMGITVPDDVSVIGFDDRAVCLSLFPNLTTMAVPKDVFGSFCVRLLTEKLKTHRSYALKMEIGTTLVERGSVRTL